MGEMKEITKEAVLQARAMQTQKGTPEAKRICFATTHKDALKRGEKYVGIFRVPFGDGFKRLFPWRLLSNARDKIHVDSYWCPANSEEEFEAIKEWKERQGGRLFLRDCLYASIAMSLIFEDDTEKTRTEIGTWAYQAKYRPHKVAIESLAEHCTNIINDFDLYKNADCVCAIPSTPDKGYDLPTEVVSIVSNALNKPNITQGFSFGGGKESARKTNIDDRWENWENAKLTFSGDLTGKTIILIDDKYQSGITIQYVAMILQKAGARRVLGLCMVKTRSDTDNQQ